MTLTYLGKYLLEPICSVLWWRQPPGAVLGRPMGDEGCLLSITYFH